MNYRNWPIAKQIGTLSFILTIVVFGLIGAISYKSAANALRDKALTGVQAQMHSVEDLLKLQYDTLLILARRNSQVFREMYPGQFYKPEGKTINILGKDTPALMQDRELINSSKSKVDRYAKLTGGNATIFVRDGDDFLRISTSLTKADGTRALGTYLGQKHPGYSKLINGETYEGYAKLFGKDYMTIYQPMKDPQGQVVAILYIGFDITDSLLQLQQSMKQLRIEESGYYMVLRQADNSLIAHPSLPIGNPVEASQLDGLPLQQLLAQQDQMFSFTNHSGDEMVSLSAAIPGWDWLIIGQAKSAELNEESQFLLYVSMLISLVGILAITALLSMVLVKTVNPLRRLQEHMEQLGKGNLSIDLPNISSASENEVDRISYSASLMTQNLRKLIRSLLDSVQTLEAQASTAQNTARLNGEEAKALMSQTDQIATAIEEMSTSIRDVANHANQSADQSRQVDSAAQEGQQALLQVVHALETLSEQLTQSHQAVEGVAKESEAINKITEVINGIAEQTNLLALNAAIEAARAGEQGRGFAVVADEVRTLASRTQASISEISQTILQLQSKVRDTASRMDESHLLGQKSSQQGSAANQQLMQIAQRIADLAISVSSIASATEQQSSVAADVTRSLHEITDLAKEGDSRANDTVQSADQLAELATTLKRQISVFKV
ncbi:methyl-accepting chemotaxis protein [Shewanella sp. C32]|uniref:Methyl-accepting chemotaxis protein n=1 Tax=Shewanella electrica TaxID=515560 RepID=A0ABT2FK97_9GAMM|nr:methyl-accepting chemotaxis protein [Shewanella electrica]MCH1924511.1 methyl-accepting chemotaxis protein [Shewanella electrica]MCS4556412.1 methyl-accepting chemotaxis protein [Shewanella electrica]